MPARPFHLQHSFMKGTVKRFYFRKGFGFVEGDQGTEYFFHYTDFTGDKAALRPGLEVEFQPEQGDKGPCAVAVVLPGGTPAAPRPARSRPAGQTPAAEATPATGAALPFALGLALGVVIGFAGHWLLSA